MSFELARNSVDRWIALELPLLLRWRRGDLLLLSDCHFYSRLRWTFIPLVNGWDLTILDFDLWVSEGDLSKTPAIYSVCMFYNLETPLRYDEPSGIYKHGYYEQSAYNGWAGELTEEDRQAFVACCVLSILITHAYRCIVDQILQVLQFLVLLILTDWLTLRTWIIMSLFMIIVMCASFTELAHAKHEITAS